MRHLDALHALARAQHGLIARRQVTDLGLDRHEWQRMRDGPTWKPITPRVLRLAGSAPARGEAVMAAVLDDGPDSRVASTSAAWWWGVPGYSPRPIRLIRTAPTRRGTELAIVHRARALPDRWTTTLDGVPVVRPELMILHLAATEHPDRVARALDNAWNKRLLSGRSVIALLADYGERGRNGTAALRELIELRGPDYTPPASNLESRVRHILAKAGIHLRLQVDTGGDDWSGRVDLRDLEDPLIIEVQSQRYHSALLDREADAIRRDKLEADGFVVVEVWDHEIWSDPATVVSKVRAARAALRAAS